MAGSHESNPVTQKTSSSKKHKSKSGKSSHKHSGKSGHREEHRDEHQEHHEVSGLKTPGQDENIQGQPETFGRVADQAETSGQEQAWEAKRKGKKRRMDTFFGLDNPFASGNPFVHSRNENPFATYGQNKPVIGGYFAGYYNNQPNIVGRRLFIEA